MNIFNLKNLVFLILIFYKISFAENVKALLVLPNQYGANYFLNLDNLVKFGFDLTITGLTEYVNPCPVYASPLGCYPIQTDLLISEVTDITDYDCMIIMSATSWTNILPCSDLIEDQRFIDLVKDAVNSGIVVAANCTAVRVLAAADVISGVNITGNYSFLNEYTQAGAIYLGRNHYPVIDGNIVTTAAGDYFNIQNCNAVYKAIVSNRSKKNNSIVNKKSIVQKTILNKIITVKTYGTDVSDGFRAICQSNDDHLIFGGYTFSGDFGNSDGLIIKTDLNGELIWQKTFGGAGFEYINSICTDPSGNIIATGYTTSFGNGLEDIYIIKFDGAGDLIWEKYYGDEYSNVAEKIILGHDDNFLITGFTESETNEDDIFVTKINNDGDKIWTKTKNEVKSQFGKDIIKTNNNNYFVLGSHGSFSSQGWSNRDVCTFNIDDAGNYTVNKNYGESGYQNWGNSICEADDDSFFITGNADITYQDLYQVYGLKTKPQENLQWHCRYGEGTFYDYGISALKLSDDRYFIIGVSKSNLYNDDIYIIMLDENGNQLDKEVYNEPGVDWIYNATLSLDKNFILIAGQTNSYGEGAYDALFLKIPVSDFETSISNDNIANDEILISNYPNPFNPVTNIGFSVSKRAIFSLIVFDICGREIDSLYLGEFQKGIHSFEYNCSNLASGVYFYQLRTNDYVTAMKRMIVLK
ncbi:MAG: DJ-1/PfpI family protein [Candidatus Delongbacteria bacterium]|nr:DJ-1/PfpI family protein [Candidatus Delongbacteria bacterium]MBN2833663.1 DJ-1/PfpI family protein [Candidatus Delongbacteria bacterium]